LRFASSEIAQEFKKEFSKGQAEMDKLMQGLDNSEGAKEADVLTEAVESLNVKSSEEATEKPVEVEK
jgi:hypothetical protein